MLDSAEITDAAWYCIVASDGRQVRERCSNNLQPSPIGTTTSMPVTNGYLGSPYRVDTFKASDGKMPCKRVGGGLTRPAEARQNLQSQRLPGGSSIAVSQSERTVPVTPAYIELSYPLDILRTEISQPTTPQEFL